MGQAVHNQACEDTGFQSTQTPNILENTTKTQKPVFPQTCVLPSPRAVLSGGWTAVGLGKTQHFQRVLQLGGYANIVLCLWICYDFGQVISKRKYYVVC
jgi:hypothetical protein